MLEGASLFLESEQLKIVILSVKVASYSINMIYINFIMSRVYT